MRSFLTALTLVSAMFLGSTALAQDDSPPADAADAALHMHAKFTPPPGWHYEIGSVRRAVNEAYDFKLYNPTVGARGTIEIVRLEFSNPVAACAQYGSRVQDGVGAITQVMGTADHNLCGFTWTNGATVSGVVLGQYNYYEKTGDWTVVIHLFYPADFRSGYWLRDAVTISESFRLELR